MELDPAQISDQTILKGRAIISAARGPQLGSPTWLLRQKSDGIYKNLTIRSDFCLWTRSTWWLLLKNMAAASSRLLSVREVRFRRHSSPRRYF